MQTAVDEINAKSDIFLSFTEVKAKGSKAVESLDFTILPRANAAGIETLALPVTPQMELELEKEGDAIEEDRAVGAVKARYALSEKQAEAVRGYYRRKGAEIRGPRKTAVGRFTEAAQRRPVAAGRRCATTGSPPAARRHRRPNRRPNQPNRENCQESSRP